MAIFLNKDSKVIVQGMTGATGMKHTKLMLADGTNIVGGVNARKAGQTVSIGGAPFRVLGVYAKQGTFLGLFSFDTYAVIPLPAFMKTFSSRLDTSIRVKVRDKNRIEIAKGELIGAMRRVRGLQPEDKNDFDINEQQALRSTIDPIKSGIAVAGLFVTGLALFVGAIGIMNITYVSVKERTREIGTRKAVGATPAQIFFQMLTESVIVSVLGGFLGIFAGKFFTQGIAMLTRNPAAITPSTAMTALIFATGTGLLFGMYPAIRASRLNPIEALRTE